MTFRTPSTIFASLAVLVGAAFSHERADAQQNLRVKDIVTVETKAVMRVRGKDGEIQEIAGTSSGIPLKGFGLVVGLAGTGDGKSAHTRRLVVNFLRRQQVAFQETEINWANVAWVQLTATYPPYSQAGDPVEIHVSAVAAESLVGGVLLESPLRGPGEVDSSAYAVVTGPLSLPNAVGHPTVARINGQITKTIETRYYEQEFDQDGEPTRRFLTLRLRRPDANTAVNVARAINQDYLFRGRSAQIEVAQVLDQATVRLWVPGDFEGREMEFLAGVLPTPVDADSRARIVVDELSKTITATGAVRVFEGTVLHRDSIKVEIPAGGTTLGALDTQLQSAGVTAEDRIQIVYKLRDAGLLNAEVTVK